MLPFRPFGPDHWAVLGLTGLIGAAIVASAPRLRRQAHDRLIRVALAAVLLGNEVGGFFIYRLAQGQWRAPLQLCDLAMLAMAWALLGGSPLVAEVAYYWGLAGSLQAVLTPDLAAGFPSLTWFTFFLGHVLVVVSAVYLVVKGRVHPTARSAWRIWWMANLYVALIGAVNWLGGTNFGYLCRKPSHPSLLDYLGPWPVYIVGMETIALVSFFGCLGFSRMVDRFVDGRTMKGLPHARCT